MNKKKFIFIFLVFISSFIMKCSQNTSEDNNEDLNSLEHGSVSGIVTKTDGEKLKGVAVIIDNQTVITNEEGSYKFMALPPGQYTIKFLRYGFEEQRLENIKIFPFFYGTLIMTMYMIQQRAHLFFHWPVQRMGRLSGMVCLWLQVILLTAGKLICIKPLLLPL